MANGTWSSRRPAACVAPPPAQPLHDSAQKSREPNAPHQTQTNSRFSLATSSSSSPFVGGELFRNHNTKTSAPSFQLIDIPTTRSTSNAMDTRYRYKPREEEQVHSFHIQVDELLDTGTNVLSQLREQRESFRSFDDRFRSIASNLGMSSTVMRLIERRSYTDKLILFGCMIVFTVFMLAVYFYYL